MTAASTSHPFLVRLLHKSAEMIARSTERDGQSELCKRRKDQAEMDIIFERPVPCQPAFLCIIGIELSLIHI